MRRPSARVAQYRDDQAARVCTRTGRPLAPASVNRPLQALRTLLRLTHKEWAAIPAVPKLRLLKEPQGRLRYLSADEETRLLGACATSRSKELLTLVTLALETGMRRGELLGLMWDRVDFARGVLQLEVTKSGRRREVPMRDVVYRTLAALPEPHEGRVFRSSAAQLGPAGGSRRRPWDTRRAYDRGTGETWTAAAGEPNAAHGA